MELRGRLVAFVIRAHDPEPHVEELPLSPEVLPQLTTAYTEGLHDDVPSKRDEATEAGRQLGAGLLSPVLPHLSGVAVTCLVPHGLLHYIPLHALEHEGHPLLETMAVSYSTSVAVAIRSRRSPMVEPSSCETFVAGNPSGDLPFAEVEAAAVARQFRTTAKIGTEVSKARVSGELRRAAAAHLATHAYFDATDPFASGILLSGGEVLDVREAMKQVLHLNLLVLSACSTGVQMVRLSNSLTGLARGFLYAGVQCLILTLWPVNDLSTMLLMNEFYSGLHRGLRVNESLRQAQLWLRNARAAEIAEWFAQERWRDNHNRIMPYERASQVWRRFVALDAEERPFRHPHYWAPFFVTGGM
jgi:CHAT domain-containing protein